MYSEAGSHRPWPLGSSRWQLASHKPRLGLSFLGSLRSHKPVSTRVPALRAARAGRAPFRLEPVLPAPPPSPLPTYKYKPRAKQRKARAQSWLREEGKTGACARALTCGKRCRGCASRACPVCSSRRRSSDAASGKEAGAWSWAAVQAQRGLAPPAAAPRQAAQACRISPGPILPEPRPSPFS